MRVAVVAVFLFACGGDDQDHAGAVDLYGRVKDHSTWATAPDYPTRKPSFTAHSKQVEIHINPVMVTALAGPKAITLWPNGSIVVKDGYDTGGSHVLTAIMEKRPDGWFFAEYDGDGNPTYSGRPKVCLDCHDNRATYSDWLYGVDLPR